MRLKPAKKTKREASIAVIMAGGLGERFWPLTRPELPKYAVKFNGKTTFLEETYRRLLPVYGAGQIFVITAKAHERLIRRLLPFLPADRVLSEPKRCNTAAATSLSAVYLKRKFGSDAILSFFPADALISKLPAFNKAMRLAVGCAAKHEVGVVVGIKPTRPATGYGYVEAVKDKALTAGVLLVGQFREKPDLKTAKRFLSAKRFYWNAGIFVWSVRTYEKAMREIAGGYYAHFEKLFSKRGAWSQKTLMDVFRKLPVVPIDRLLVEKMKNLAMVPADMGWDDIGSFEALRRMKGDRHGNVVLTDAALDGVSGSVVGFAPGQRAVVSGVKDVIIVQSAGETLICPRTKAEDVRELKKLWQKHFL